MKTITTILRFLLGAGLLVFGANKFLHFMGTPEMAGTAGQLMEALVAAGYFMPIVGAVMIATGLSLFANKFVPLTLTLMAPVSINFVLFHVFLDLAGTGMSAVILTLHLFLFYVYRDRFQGILSA